jgi:catalase (peroxidase I)
VCRASERAEELDRSTRQLGTVSELCGAPICETARDFVAAWNKVMNLDRFDLA